MIIDVNHFEGSWEDLGVMYGELYDDYLSLGSTDYSYEPSRSYPSYYREFIRGFSESLGDVADADIVAALSTPSESSIDVRSYDGVLLAVRYTGADLTVSYGELEGRPFLFAGPIASWPGSMSGMGRQGMCYCDPHQLPNPNSSTPARMYSAYMMQLEAFMPLINDRRRPIAVAAPDGFIRAVHNLPYVRHKGVPSNEHSALSWFEDSREDEVLLLFDSSAREVTIVRGLTFDERTYSLEDT